jgi:hypothetical protein
MAEKDRSSECQLTAKRKPPPQYRDRGETSRFSTNPNQVHPIERQGDKPFLIARNIIFFSDVFILATRNQQCFNLTMSCSLYIFAAHFLNVAVQSK